MRRRLILVVVALVASLATFGTGYYLATDDQAQVNSGNSSVQLKTITDARLKKFAPLINVFEQIKQQFYFQVPPDEKLIEAAIQGMIKELPDSGAKYTYYYNPRKAKVERSVMSGKFGGVGIRLTIENGQFVIASTFQGGPSEKAGIKPGDVIVSVDGEKVAGVPSEVLSSLLRGEPGSKVKVTVYRIGPGELTFEVTRDSIATPAVRTRIFADGKIGYIALEIFSDTADAEVKAALKQLLEVDKVKGIILDLRGNPGGGQHVAVRILSQFIPGGKPAVQVFYRGGSRSTLATHSGGIALEIPLVVLIDGGSASASELLAAAFKDYKRAVIIGETSHGKGVGQSPTSLPDGSLIMVVNHEFRSPLGKVVNNVGVEPDIRVPTSSFERQRGADPALDKAIEVLLQKIKP